MLGRNTSDQSTVGLCEVNKKNQVSPQPNQGPIFTKYYGAGKLQETNQD